MKTLSLIMATALVFPNLLLAEPLALPEGEVILVVSGAIHASNVDGRAEFDLPMLQALGPQTIQTSTIWTEGTQTFTGVPLEKLMATLGVKDGTLRATAINDYTIEIPVADAVPGGPILAYLNNGDPMSVREKGPLWVIYPYDSDPSYKSEIIYSRSIWQLNRIEVIE